jgi:CubicO group peptidase (beta-lactamase class C family)
VALEPFELAGAAYGGLIGTVADGARLVALHCNRGTVDGTTLLDAESVAALVSITTEGKPYDLGLGWFRPTGAPGGTRVEHLGGGMGFWNVMRVDPERRRGAVVMSNTTRHWPVAQLADSVMATLDG